MAGTGLGVSVPNVTPGGGGEPWIRAYKLSTTDRSTDVTPTADPELSLTLPQGKYWMESYLIVLNGADASGFRFRWDHDQSGNLSARWNVKYRINFGTEAYLGGMWVGSPGTELNLATVPTANGTAIIELNGTLSIGAGGRTVSLLWAQSVSQATPTRVGSESWVRALPLANVDTI